MMEKARVLGKRILLVEDDPGARESVNLLLRIDRHTVVEAADGKAALDLFAKQSFDLVIADYFLPEMRGSELAMNIRRLVPSQPILLVTAYFEKLVDSILPVDSVLSKPFAVGKLRQAVTKLLC